MSGVSVTFGVTVVKADESKKPQRVMGFPMYFAYVVEIWPNGDGTTTHKIVKKFRSWSAPVANRDAMAYMYATYRREEGDATHE